MNEEAFLELREGYFNSLETEENSYEALIVKGEKILLLSPHGITRDEWACDFIAYALATRLGLYAIYCIQPSVSYRNLTSYISSIVDVNKIRIVLEIGGLSRDRGDLIYIDSNNESLENAARKLLSKHYKLREKKLFSPVYYPDGKVLYLRIEIPASIRMSKRKLHLFLNLLEGFLEKLKKLSVPVDPDSKHVLLPLKDLKSPPREEDDSEENDEYDDEEEEEEEDYWR